MINNELRFLSFLVACVIGGGVLSRFTGHEFEDGAVGGFVVVVIMYVIAALSTTRHARV